MFFYRKFIVTLGILMVVSSVFANEAPTGLKQPPSIPSQSVSDKLNINTASLKDFTKVKGLSKTKAKNIIAYHQKHGNFKTMEDLKLVKGFKKMKATLLKSIQDQMTV